MKLLLASSADGYFAKGPDDDMKWTGSTDKAIFRLLTMSEGSDVLLAGSRTFDQMPPLPHRIMVRVSRKPKPGGTTLEWAAKKWPNAWLIGGPTVAEAALELGLITRAFICISPVELGSGIHAQGVARLLPHEDAKVTLKIGDVQVKIFMESQKWPGK